ncbi:RNA-guided endonuclease InsQ/TnpB family protein [Cyanobacterium aponinum]|uniref:Transposase, IS605 OrfB family n=1 Tax=Cyanobacterium aponinum (strain PCC 10605) TaxID=755178 RepID=K9Z4L9_CYAAP|nr:RNA-guided endonuclease TnpB family protein [Cyanobacterium aponinum]AFZ53530.1 transposase, IS605 OrfB family [Cyanobacterium aponinum PCC 10605]
MYGSQQVLLNPDKDTKSVLEYICIEANKLYNIGLYYARQIYFKEHRYITKFELDKEIKTNLHYRALRSCVAQQTLRSVYEGMSSYKTLKSKANKGDLHFKPKLPNYRKKGLYQAVYPARWVKLAKNNQLKFTLGKQTKVWFGIDHFYLQMPSNLNYKDIKEYRIIPRNGCFYLEFVYEQKIEPISLCQDNVLGIDHGINNWLTCVSNVGTSFIVDGKQVKSMNNWYNKKVAILKENRTQGFWSKRLMRITEKRNRQMRDAVNKSARIVINHCLQNNIGTIVFGWNQGQKQEANMGKKTNQKFVVIPTARLKDRIKDLSELYSIQFIEQEESYTSKASFLDLDFIPTHGEKPEIWKSSGKRVKRGLFRTANNLYINADCNGSANIIRKKVTAKSSILSNVNLDGVSMGALIHPQRIRLWSAKTKRSNVDLSHWSADA